MERKTSFFLMMSVFAFSVIIILYVFSLRSQLQEVRANQDHYVEQINSLNKVEDSEAMTVNREFIKTFFTYKNPNERYESIKPLMTDKGYRATHPSGIEIPQTEEAVSSSISELKTFQYKDSKTAIEFLNEFKVTTEFNDVGSTEEIIVKTQLIFIDGEGWKVEDVILVNNL